MQKINYVVATWSGPRWLGIQPWTNGFLQLHLEKLEQVKHSLAQISIGYPYNPDEEPSYSQWIQKLCAKNGTPITVYPVPNRQQSYGQWSRIFEACRDQFTHYVFIEDDYVPVKNGFDQILVDMYESKRKDNCGYLCGSAWPGKSPNQIIAAVSNGISSTDVLTKIWEENKSLLSGNQGRHCQIYFSKAFTDNGFTIRDYMDRFRCLYEKHKVLQQFWDGEHDEDLIVPLRFLIDPNAKIDSCVFK